MSNEEKFLRNVNTILYILTDKSINKIIYFNIKNKTLSIKADCHDNLIDSYDLEPKDESELNEFYTYVCYLYLKHINYDITNIYDYEKQYTHMINFFSKQNNNKINYKLITDMVDLKIKDFCNIEIKEFNQKDLVLIETIELKEIDVNGWSYNLTNLIEKLQKIKDENKKYDVQIIKFEIDVIDMKPLVYPCLELHNYE